MIIQNIVFPSECSDYPQEMFYRGSGFHKAQEGSFFLAAGQCADFDTFFNAVSVGVWRTDCRIETLSFHVSGEGRALVRFGLHRENKPLLWLSEKLFDLSSEGHDIPLSFWKDLTEGVLFVRVCAQSHVNLAHSYFETAQPVRGDVKLGLVITHFNRQKQALAAANLLGAQILDAAGGEIELAIVDNSQNFPTDALTHPSHIHVIANRNCGGSGGFTRGLLHFKDEGFTHCLFMDDDASCLPESVLRARAYFCYCTEKKIGLSGILLKDSLPQIVHEAGCIWKNADWSPVCQGLNVSDPATLLSIERCRQEANYGAWCFFCFAIADVERFPFPFFVRGDDITFSLQNHMSIRTICGISTRIDSFMNKESPMTRYLAFRSLLVMSRVVGDASPSMWWRRFKEWNHSCTRQYAYGQADGTYLALNDVLTRDHLFDGDMDGSRFRKSLAAFKQPTTAYSESTFGKYRRPSKPEPILRKLFRKLTVNGLLIPTCFFKKGLLVPKGTCPNFRQFFCFRTIYYYNDENGTVYATQHKKVAIVMRLLRDVTAFIRITLHYQVAVKRIDNAIEKLTQEAYWRKYLLDTP